MKKLSIILLVLFTSLSAKAGCDFSGITFGVVNQQGNNFYFQTNMHSDTCWYYTFTAYSFTNKEEYQLEDMGGWTGVTFNQKGKYEVRMNIFNECEECDTVLTVDVDITIFNKLGFGYNVGAKNCKYYQFELEDRRDKCTEYYYQIWKGDDYINRLSEKDWMNLDDSTLYFNYSFDENLLIYSNEKSQRTLTHEFKDSGRYLMIPMLYNNCTQIDTWAFKKLNVCVGQRMTSIKKVAKEDLKNVTVVGYYNMLGRKVDALEPNKIYIILYSDGRRQKVMRTN